MGVSDQPEDTMILTDEQIDTLNAARLLLDKYESRCKSEMWGAPRDATDVATALATDYAQVAVRANVAASAIFDVLNSTNAHNVRSLSEEQLHNRSARRAA